MKALTLKDYKNEPYATWVEQGLKGIETRNWKPTDWKEGEEWDILITCSKTSPSPNAGKAICVVTLYHIEEMTKEHEERAMCEVVARNKKGEPKWAWFLKNRRLLSRKFNVSGELYIFNVTMPEDITLIPAQSMYKDMPVATKKGRLF